MQADWRDFLPRILDNGAYLEVRGIYEEDDNEYADRSYRWSDTFLKEKLTLFSTGYVYHPRFLLFRASLTGAMSQEVYDTSLVPSDEWRQDDGYEYDFSLHFLPEHPYNLELFARRYEPLFTERFASRENNIATSHGADFRYRRKPYFMHARFSDDTLTSGEVRSDVQRLGLNGEYFRQYEDNDLLSVTAAYNPTRFDRSTGLEGATDEAILGNLLAFGRWRLNSSLTANTLEQDDFQTGRFESEQLFWHERFDLQLPAGFRTEATWRYQDSETRFPDAAVAGFGKFEDQSRDLSASLIHQLFESLTSHYTYTQSSRRSDGGGSDSAAHQLGFAYDKTIPGGRLLLNASGGRNEIDSGGSTDVVNEGHPGVAVPGSFELAQQNVERASILLFVRSPVSPFENVRLTEGVDYTVVALVNALEIVVLSLPPQFVLPGTYDFTVSYSLQGGGFSMLSRFTSVSGSLQLFHDRLTPYASFTTVDSEVQSGFYPGEVPDSSTTTAGLLFRLGGFRARGEYRDVDWQTSPYTLWLGELNYVGPISRSTRLSATASHRRWDYPEGRSGLPGEPDNQTTDLASIDLQQKLFGRSLMVSLGGAWSETRGLFDSTSRSVNSTLNWHVGRTDLSLGATIYESEAEGGGIAFSSRTRTLYYLQLRRELF